MATLAEAFNEMSAATAEMLAERERTQAELRYLADHDPLTGLFNRRRFQAELQRQLEEARQNPTQGALIFIDLDGFKYVNDSLGHQTGDLLLTQIGNLLQDQVKDNDVLARLGGDEFAVILPRTGRAEAEELARDILHALKRHQTVIDGHSLQVSASIGIALFPQHGMTAERLLSRADLALYQVKESGRNSYCLFTPDRAGLDEAKLTWEKRIRLALENDGFVLYCQPILDLRSHQ
ncbi:MAG: diguanylate cyclase, partial [Actinobacteria bacterium]|nr:diguanylate cyclase [Actinomycetota bacterium]